MSDNRENKHNEEPHDSEEEKYSFLQETVKDEQRSKKGIMGNLCRLAGRGLIFGLAAGLAFYALRPWAMTHLGGEKVTIPLDQEETPVENETDTKDQEAQEEEIQYPDLTVEDYQEMNHALYQVALSEEKVWLRSMPCTGMKAGRMQGSRLYRELFSGIMEQIF